MRRPRACRAPAAARRRARRGRPRRCGARRRRGRRRRRRSRSKPAWNANSVRRWSRKPIPVPDVRPAAAVEPERDPERRLGARADDRRLAPRDGARLGAERPRKTSFSDGRRSVTRMPFGKRANDDSLCLEGGAQIGVGCASRRSSPPPAARRIRRRRAPRGRARAPATSDSTSYRGSRSAAAAMRAAGAAIGAGARRASSTAAVVGRSDGVPDAERRVAERLRHRAQDDQVRALVEPAARPTRRRTRRTPRRRRPQRVGWRRASSTSSAAGVTAPVGFSGLQRQIRLAPSVSQSRDRRR